MGVGTGQHGLRFRRGAWDESTAFRGSPHSGESVHNNTASQRERSDRSCATGSHPSVADRRSDATGTAGRAASKVILDRTPFAAYLGCRPTRSILTLVLFML